MRNLITKLSKVIWSAKTKRYLDYMRSPAWRLRSREHRIKYPHCQICYFRRSVQTHHWHYKTLGQERDVDLCSVCLVCHSQLHYVPIAANDNQQLTLPFPDIA